MKGEVSPPSRSRTFGGPPGAARKPGRCRIATHCEFFLPQTPASFLVPVSVARASGSPRLPLNPPRLLLFLGLALTL